MEDPEHIEGKPADAARVKDGADHLMFLMAARKVIERAIQDHMDAITFVSEAVFWKKKYDHLVQQNIKDSEATSANMLHLLMQNPPTESQEKTPNNGNDPR